MNQEQAPFQQRSKSKAFGNKTLGMIMMVIGTGMALFGIAIIRDVIFGYINRSIPITGDRAYMAAFCLAITIVGYIIGNGGWKRYRLGKKLVAPSAEEVLAKDQRAPVVYIRSFREDDKLLTRRDKLNIAASSISLPIFATTSKEEAMAHVMNELGPVVAIGNPREALPELGAARMYFKDEEWQEKILEFMQKARLVILLGGPTKNLWWEIEQAIQKLPPKKLICLEIFDKGTNHELFEQDLEKMLQKPGSIRSQKSPKGWLSRLFTKDYGKVIYFDQNWSPKVAFISPLYGKMAPYNNVTNQFEPALRKALRPIFAELGLKGPKLPVNKLFVFLFVIAIMAALLVAYILLMEA